MMVVTRISKYVMNVMEQAKKNRSDHKGVRISMEDYQINTIRMIHKHGGRLDALLDEQIVDLYAEWSAETADANWLLPTEHRITIFYKWATTAPCNRKRTGVGRKEDIQVTGPNFKPKSHYLTAEGYPLGTECWCFYIEFNGLLKWCCGDTQDDAWQSVIEFLNSEYTANQGGSLYKWKDGKKWYQVNPDADKLTQRLQIEDSKATVEFSVSPYDIPASVCSYYDEVGDQVVINFKYISDSNEPTAPQQHDNLITWMLGKNSGRLYGIKVNARECVFEAIRLKDTINKALEHLIEHPHHKDRQDNYRLARESLIEKSDAIFGVGG